MRPPPLNVPDILRWADAFYQKRDRWPHRDDGAVEGTIDLTWRKIDSALKLGNRGLNRGSSLAKLFLARRKHLQYAPNVEPAWQALQQYRLSSLGELPAGVTRPQASDQAREELRPRL